MQITGNTSQLYNIIVDLYNGIFDGNSEFILQLELLPNMSPALMEDFLDLIEDAINDFEAKVEIEVLDHASVLE